MDCCDLGENRGSSACKTPGETTTDRIIHLIVRHTFTPHNNTRLSHLCGPMDAHLRTIEAGERLGFLPGDLSQKVDPYLRPLYDALYDLMGYDKVQKAFERNAIEIAPLAFMRGRTLNNAFVILDEAQNTSTEQMKMFLTRIGFGAKAVVTGDVSQIDLPRGQLSGLIDAERVLKRVKGIAFTRFSSADVVRHPLVARIVDAYVAQGSATMRAGVTTRRKPLPTDD